MTSVLTFTRGDGTKDRIEVAEPAFSQRPSGPARSRLAYAATHVAADPLGDNAPGTPAAIDWDATLEVRRYLWSWGLGVADAMDTAQRGMGLDWAAIAALISRSAAEAAATGGDLVVGVGTDQGPPQATGLADVAARYTEQLSFAESVGATPVLMASRQLAALARGPEDYADVYGRLLSQVREPVLLHWLGEAFDPALAGYWGSPDRDAALEVLLGIVRDHAAAVSGVKVSVLETETELRLRAGLPAGVRCLTGDDFNYLELIRGDGEHHSDALLGAFGVIAPAAATALHRLDDGDEQGFTEALAPTVPLSRHVFAAPTQYYKTDVAFLAWLGGRQAGFTLIGGLHGGRSVPHLIETFRLAANAGMLAEPELAVHRMGQFLDVAGVTR